MNMSLIINFGVENDSSASSTPAMGNFSFETCSAILEIHFLVARLKFKAITSLKNVKVLRCCVLGLLFETSLANGTESWVYISFAF
jgi:hypothetical protein